MSKGTEPSTKINAKIFCFPNYLRPIKRPPSSSEDNLRKFLFNSAHSSLSVQPSHIVFQFVTEGSSQNANWDAVEHFIQIKSLVFYHIGSKAAVPQRDIFNSDPRWIRSQSFCQNIKADFKLCSRASTVTFISINDHLKKEC